MSYYRVDKRRKVRKAEEDSGKEITYGKAKIEYAGPAPNTFAGGALGGGIGAVVGYLLAGPTGAAILGGLGAFIGGFVGAQIDEAAKELAKAEGKKDRS
ncbi:MAG: hypothetical protein DRO12_06445 [Thermoprotei archaeon]|nr:hypothetical protein [Desulfurococcales archaeon]RLG74788.1 MAG: hypothetical protein DRO12_06445 [Thermoprotei archaeon]